MAEQTPAVGMERKLAAIFSTDVAGYSRLMGNDEEATIRTLTAYRAVISSLIQQYRGRVVDSPGDNLLAEFASVVDAVRCAVEMERAVALDTNEAMSYAALAEVLSRVGRSGEGLETAARALRLKPFFADDHLASVGIAYAMAGRYEEAQAPLQRFLSRYPNRLDIHLTLAAVYSELGKEAEARAEAAEVLRLNSNFSLAVYKQRMPIKDPVVLERHIAALRKTGLK
jgi:tetratricopeptide (TPR) repeat protein